MISKGEIENLAQLARLKLSADEVAGLQNDISSILEYIGQVSAVPTQEREGEKPLLRNVMREDTPRAPEDALMGKREKLLEALPRREGDFAVVRKIIQKDE